MFNRKRIDALEAEIKELRRLHIEMVDRVSKLEKGVEPYRIGQAPPSTLWYPWWTDSRPTVTVREALDLILTHLKLKVTKTEAAPSYPKLEKA